MFGFFENITIENRGTVILSFLLAFSLWASLKLNQTYETTLEFPCKIHKVPENVYVARTIIPKLTFRVEGLGNKLLLTNFRAKDTLMLRYDERFSQGVVNLRQVLPNFEGVPQGIQLLKTEEDTLHIQTDKLQSIKVPIELKGEIRLARTYQLTKKPMPQPDSVWVHYPSGLKNIPNKIETQSFITPLMNGNHQLSVKLLQPNNCLLSQKTTNIQFSAESYTELTLLVPIVVTDLPLGRTLKWNVNYSTGKPCLVVKGIVPFSDYESVMKNKYVYSLSYKQLIDKTYLIPDLSFLPLSLKIISTEPNQLYYVLTED